jgi:predicted Zn-dependent protease
MLQDLGQIYFHGGHYEKALQALSAGISAKNPKSQLYLGRSLMELGRLAEARDTFEDLVHVHPDQTQAYYYLGESSGRLGDMFGAHYNLGRYYRQKEDMKNADFHLKRALKLATDDSKKQMVERQLKEMKHPGKDKKPGTG